MVKTGQKSGRALMDLRRSSGADQMRRDLVFDRFFQVRDGEGFGDVVDRSEDQRLFHAFKIIRAGHHDDLCRRADFSRPA